MESCTPQMEPAGTEHDRNHFWQELWPLRYILNPGIFRISLLLYHAEQIRAISAPSSPPQALPPSLFRLSAKPVPPQFTQFVLHDFALNVTASGTQEAAVPRCLFLLAEPPSPSLSKHHKHSAPLGSGVRLCPSPGKRCQAGSSVGSALLPCAVQPSCESREAVKPHLPFSTTAVVELMSFCSPFWHVLLLLARRDEAVLPSVLPCHGGSLVTQAASLTHRQLLLALWSPLKNARNLHFTKPNPRLSVLPVGLSLFSNPKASLVSGLLVALSSRCC